MRVCHRDESPASLLDAAAILGIILREMRLQQPILDRLLKHSMPVPECGCWIWLGAANAKGYGTFRLDGISLSTHRVSWMEHNQRPIPDGLFVCHRCDIPSCINPDHLFLGTHQINIADALSKGRLKHAQRRLVIPADQLPTIFAHYAACLSVKKTGAHFAFNPATVYAAIKRHRPELIRGRGRGRPKKS